MARHRLEQYEVELGCVLLAGWGLFVGIGGLVACLALLSLAASAFRYSH